MAMTSFPSFADTDVDSKYASKNVSLYLKNDQPTSIQMKLMIHYMKFSKWEIAHEYRCGKFKHHIHWPKFRWDLAVFFNLQSTLGKYSIKACDRWILPSTYFPLHYIHMNSTTNLFCTESHLFVLWREQMEGNWYHHTPYFSVSVTGLGPFTLPLILLM